MRLRGALAGLAIVLAAGFVAGCEGGSSSPPTTIFTVPTPTPTATPVGATPTPTPTASPSPTPSPTPTPTATPVPTATPSPTPSPTPFLISLNTSTFSFTTAGSTGTTTATEAGYAGPLTAANGSPSCSGIATIAPASGTGPSTTFTITAVAAGTCQFVITDNHGGFASVSVTVTTTTGTISTVRRK